MERNAPVRKPHTSTADLLTWSEKPAPDSPATAPSSTRSHQPSDRISKVLSGGQVTDEEAQSLASKKPCSGYKLKEMTGSDIFGADGTAGDASETTPAHSSARTSVRIVQQATNGISQISFSTEETVSPKKPTSIPEVAKQRELSGTLQSDSDSKNKKQISNAKFKEISGHDIFAPPQEITPRSQVARSLVSRSNILFGDDPVVKTAKKIHNQKFQELTGNNIFKGDVPPGSAEKPLSTAKLREISGNDIFADGKAESRDYFGGVRKPPGGESSIALI
ncbi:DNA oxidative demethylase ALKBH2 [Linum perenne]